MKKLRHQKQQTFKKQEYIKQNTITQVTELIKTKLEMWNIGNNLGEGERKCFGCKECEEITEHICSCKEVQKTLKDEIQVDFNDNKSLNKITNYIKKYMKWRDENNNQKPGKQTVPIQTSYSS